jgi:hypothetical protein
MRPKETSAQPQPLQPEFNFGNSRRPTRRAQNDGLEAWRTEQMAAMRNLATELGLPLSHHVEVCLKDGVILRGNLRVGEVLLNLEKFDRNKMALQVDGVVFTYGEIESCVRLD